MTPVDFDIISIEGLNIDTIIGVYDWEQQQQQRLTVDLQMAWDNQAPAQSDDIKQALDYARVSAAVSDWVQSQPRQLIETVAEGIAQLVMREFMVSSVQVKVSKPGAIPAAANVAVTINRRQIESPFG
ncbi:dihydroneopterin aldolase [Idiomarina seosinensis]|uniref:dihydroneopterin aldolase n=1 Tax=Idiomarina seosinensis TaxID=281739 RepID=UPI00384D5C50